VCCSGGEWENNALWEARSKILKSGAVRAEGICFLWGCSALTGCEGCRFGGAVH